MKKVKDVNVFVYGTLMRAERNHHFIEHELYLGEGVLKDYELYEVSKYFPGIISSKGNIVKGEVYEVKQEILRKLDMLEEEGETYVRKEEEVTVNDKTVKADVYVYNQSIRGYKKINENWKERDISL